MLGARQLSITWGGNSLYWRWAPHIHSRFSEVAELLSVFWLDIQGRINTQILSPKTIYETYLVYKLANRSYGLVFARTSIRFDNERDDFPWVECNTVCIQPRKSVLNNQNVEFRRNRKDGWMEIKTGEFINDGGDDGELETRIMEIERLHAKSGLLVEGIEFRPKEGA